MNIALTLVLFRLLTRSCTVDNIGLEDVEWILAKYTLVAQHSFAETKDSLKTQTIKHHL